MQIKIFRIKSLAKRYFFKLTGGVSQFKVSVKCNHTWYGNRYGGFYICPELLTGNSIVYSFGIGEDISFDMQVIESHNCQVFGFDPTPKSINWVKQQQNIPSKFKFFEYGIANRTGMVDFYLPINSKHVSGSFVKQNNVNDKEKIWVEMRSYNDIIKILGHSQIDVLKMDIEGAEYTVLDSILESSVPINQILIEFHDRLFVKGENKTIEAINKLKDHGYEIFGVSDSFEEVSFIKKSILKVI
jgi:FkbM family methyltransferase